jgi:hypothetical protein
MSPPTYSKLPYGNFYKIIRRETVSGQRPSIVLLQKEQIPDAIMVCTTDAVFPSDLNFMTTIKISVVYHQKISIVNYQWLALFTYPYNHRL